MAYCVKKNTGCFQHGCKKAATHYVYNLINDRMGQYCKKHAHKRVDEMNKSEKKW